MPAAEESGRKANVVLIMPDDVSWGDFSVFNDYGPRTPRIDALARSSVQLTDFHVSPTCSPTRAALMTGRYNNATGVWHTILGRYFLRGDEPTMADVFRANGYRTALFGKWHLGDYRPFRPEDRGFEHTVMHMGGGIDQQPNPWGNRDIPPATLFIDRKPAPLVDENDGLEGAYSTNTFTNRAMDFIRTRHAANEPFFAYLAYNIAHSPFDAPPDARGDVNARTAAIENLDRNIGRLIDLLEELKIADETLVVFLTDNGGASSRFRGNKATHFEGGHRVPCFLRWPARGLGGSQASGREVAELTAHIDLLPTLMDLLALRDVPQRTVNVPLHGSSLRSLLLPGGEEPASALRGRTLVVDNQRMNLLVRFRQAAVMRDAFDAQGALVHKWRLSSTDNADRWILHDVLADPRQERDLSSRPDLQVLKAELRKAYDDWWDLVSRRSDEPVRPWIGHPEDGEICLLAHDWQVEGMVPWNHTLIAEGLRINGPHAVEFVRAGTYRFDLRRWPRELEAETSVRSRLARPISHARDNRPTFGTALPVHSARLRIQSGNQVVSDLRQVMSPETDAVVFVVQDVLTGPATIQTWFYDEAGDEIAGAYYVYTAPSSAVPETVPRS